MNQDKKQCEKGTERECLKCQAKFDTWISQAEFSDDVENEIKGNFHQHCPACRKMERDC